MNYSAASTKHPYKDDLNLRNQLVTEYLPLVNRIVQRFAVYLPASIELEDLVHAGVIGLIQAIERYDPSRETKLLTFATFRIRGAILSELRSRDVLSRSSRKKVRELEKAYLKLEKRLGRQASDEEVAEEMGLSLKQVRQVKKIASISFISLDEIGCSSKKDRRKMMAYLVNNEGDDALSLTRLKELKGFVARAIEDLPEKQKLVISLYYQEELTMKEVGQVMGLTESRISQIHTEAVLNLRKRLRREGLIDDT